MKNIISYGINEQSSTLESNKESLCLVSNNGKTLIVDCPDHTTKSLFNHKELVSDSPMTKIDFLIITHIDNDHVSGFSKIIIAKFFGENRKKLKLIAHPEIKDKLWRMIEGGLNQDRTEAKTKEMRFEDYVDFIPLTYGTTVNLDGFGSIESFHRSTKHSPNMDVLAFKVFDEEGNNIGNFSADTAFDQELIDFLSRGGGDIIHEVGSFVDEGSHSHTSIKELVEKVSHDIQSRIYLNHVPESKEPEIRSMIRKTGSPIRFADEFYPDYLKKAKLKAMEIVTTNHVLFPGSYDPFTNGHISVLKQYLESHPTSIVTVLIAVNPDKKGTFSYEERKFIIKESLPEHLKDKVKVVIHNGIVADYLYAHGMDTVIKGLRNQQDYLYEKDLAMASNRFSGEVKTIMITQNDEKLGNVSSSALKILLDHGGDVQDHAGPFVRESLRMKRSGKLLIGVTGSIGSGKTTFCNKIVEESKAQGVPVTYINLDSIGHELHSRTDLPIFQKTRNQIAEKIGYWALDSDGLTDRKRLGEYVFSNKKNLDELMDIMLKPMLFLLRMKINEAPEGIILVEGAVIMERKLSYLFDENMIDIFISEELQLRRVGERDRHLTEEQIRKRISSQLSNEGRREMILRNQAGHFDRMNMRVDGEIYGGSEVYQELVREYVRRKNIIR